MHQYMTGNVPKSDFTSFARVYDKHRRPGPDQIRYWGKLVSDGAEPHNGVFLDLGCGTCTYTLGIEKSRSGSIIGIDPSGPMLKQALSKNITFPLIRGCAENIPLKDGSVCGVTMMMVLHHIDDRDKAFEETCRILSPKGQLTILTRSHQEIRSSALALFPGLLEIDLLRFPDIPVIASLLEHAGFENIIIDHIQGSRHPREVDEYLENVQNRFVTTLRYFAEDDFQRRFEVFERKIRDRYRGTIDEVTFSLVRAQVP